MAPDVATMLLKTLCQCTEQELKDEYADGDVQLARLSAIIAHASQQYNIHKSRALTGAPEARAEAILKLANKALKLQNASWPLAWKGGLDAPIDKSAVDNMEQMLQLSPYMAMATGDTSIRRGDVKGLCDVLYDPADVGSDPIDERAVDKLAKSVDAIRGAGLHAWGKGELTSITLALALKAVVSAGLLDNKGRADNDQIGILDKMSWHDPKVLRGGGRLGGDVGLHGYARQHEGLGVDGDHHQFTVLAEIVGKGDVLGADVLAAYLHDLSPAEVSETVTMVGDMMDMDLGRSGTVAGAETDMLTLIAATLGKGIPLLPATTARGAAVRLMHATTLAAEAPSAWQQSGASAETNTAALTEAITATLLATASGGEGSCATISNLTPSETTAVDRLAALSDAEAAAAVLEGAIPGANGTYYDIPLRVRQYVMGRAGRTTYVQLRALADRLHDVGAILVAVFKRILPTWIPFPLRNLDFAPQASRPYSSKFGPAAAVAMALKGDVAGALAIWSESVRPMLDMNLYKIDSPEAVTLLCRLVDLAMAYDYSGTKQIATIPGLVPVVDPATTTLSHAFRVCRTTRSMPADEGLGDRVFAQAVKTAGASIRSTCQGGRSPMIAYSPELAAQVDDAVIEAMRKPPPAEAGGAAASMFRSRTELYLAPSTGGQRDQVADLESKLKAERETFKKEIAAEKAKTDSAKADAATTKRLADGAGESGHRNRTYGGGGYGGGGGGGYGGYGGGGGGGYGNRYSGGGGGNYRGGGGGGGFSSSVSGYQHNQANRGTPGSAAAAASRK